MKNTEKAFKWVIGILEKYGIQFQITGGFAAKFYGSDRPLNDIDIIIPNQAFDVILPDIKNYIVWGPGRYTDETWDLWLVTLEFEGQEIDITGAEGVRAYDTMSGEWKELSTDFSKSEHGEIYGIKVPIIGRKDLMEEKKMLGRDVDKEDVVMLTR